MLKKIVILIIAINLALVFTGNLALHAASYNQAPMLDELVEGGTLPPVKDRLPSNPLVIEPWHKIGEYGGTWHRVTTNSDWYFIRMCMYGASLVRFEESAAKIVPNLVTKWESNENKSVWTLHFREGVKWSDGAPFTVDDVIFWWRDMILNPEHSESAPHWTKIGGSPMELEKLGPYALKAKFQGPNIYFIRGLAMWVNGHLGPSITAPAHYLKQFHPKYSDEYNDFETFEEENSWGNPGLPTLTAWRPIKEESGKRLVLERNPYYYAVDPEGNQLPYIDSIRVDFASDKEVINLKRIQGKIDMQIFPYVGVRDIAMLKSNAAKGNYEVLMWNSGVGAGPQFMPNQNHPDPEKRKVYTNPKFRRALSHAIDRSKIQKMVFYGTGYKTTGHFSALTPYFDQAKRGQEMFKKWRDLAVEYEPEKSKKLLNEIGIVDQDDDGWRDLPNGQELKLRLDLNTEAPTIYLDTSQIVKDLWRKVGLKTIVNPVSGAQLGTMVQYARQDIRVWDVGGVPNIVLYPHFLVPVNNSRWAPLYGGWYQVKGTAEEGTELDKDPRDRTPPRERPPEDSYITKMQDLLDEALKASSWEESNQLVTEIIQVYLDHGPFIIGTVAGYPRPGVVKNNFKNVPRREELRGGGWQGPWNAPYPAMTNPCQYYVESE